MPFKISDDVRVRKHTNDEKQGDNMFAEGTKVQIKHHDSHEKLTYLRDHDLYWFDVMDDFEGKMGVVETHDSENRYRIVVGEQKLWFSETSLVPIEYNVF